MRSLNKVLARSGQLITDQGNLRGRVCWPEPCSGPGCRAIGPKEVGAPILPLKNSEYGPQQQLLAGHEHGVSFSLVDGDEGRVFVNVFF